MFDQFFKSPRAVERHSTSPLLEERLRYLARCARQGSTKSSLRQIAQHLLVFIDYLHLEAADEISVEQIHAAADRWVRNVTSDSANASQTWNPAVMSGSVNRLGTHRVKRTTETT